MAEQAAAADLISAGRLQLGVSWGSRGTSLRGYDAFGHAPEDGETDAGMARRNTELFRRAIDGDAVAQSDPRMTGWSSPLAIEPRSPGLGERICWGSAAVQGADAVRLTVPNQLGADYNARLKQTLADHVAPAIRCALAFGRAKSAS
jgi:alkanesulfonate monooxygenase SsuD/methylene tetrahydromethanopterin reductase-like flavin-dependent oxidoreductase (luciferase family)